MWSSLQNCANQRLIKDFVPGVITILKCDNELLFTIASSCITSFYQQVDLLAPCADDVMEIFLDGKSDMLGSELSHSSCRIMEWFEIQKLHSGSSTLPNTS